ncbi:hypothetical protein [Gottfriedia solisilvae]|uniref:Uncharacterized protein n=1 Tax=Gottfriedia solisilvae TaxID=1516104 RepID=A0A8J3ACR6_9BACI|nr:hypothetical protein [Gottfriedia solisilvae]GGI11462.1 hypothetical protein GCM10007380_07960 [Gottfriedia solisilvae]
MGIKAFYYDGSGHGYFFFQSELLKNQSLMSGETRKVISGNPYLIDWHQVRQSVVSVDNYKKSDI